MSILTVTQTNRFHDNPTDPTVHIHTYQWTGTATEACSRKWALLETSRADIKLEDCYFRMLAAHDRPRLRLRRHLRRPARHATVNLPAAGARTAAR
ncbi:hypothetical protein [Naumannella halotolerans]|uniref:Uncharacterized protein n=1 Tax=Naumannella halotolerans TaxID=993414 RepID=A0A4R7J456_9ACTN|nr:hypothetical protein [Naumannella halotolerans]TDT31119.1 hypothetical protein CLV29_2532 [Naumannella halotolerans]